MTCSSSASGNRHDAGEYKEAFGSVSGWEQTGSVPAEAYEDAKAEAYEAYEEFYRH